MEFTGVLAYLVRPRDALFAVAGHGMNLSVVGIVVRSRRGPGVDSSGLNAAVWDRRERSGYIRGGGDGAARSGVGPSYLPARRSCDVLGGGWWEYVEI